MLEKTEFINRILAYSYQITVSSPAIKPFIRQTIEAVALINNFKNPNAKKNAWNFDYALQKILLYILKKNAIDEEIAGHCINRYKKNLSQLYLRRKSELDRIKKKEIQYVPGCEHRDKFIYERFKPGSRFLYVGCGSGTECLRYASKGYCVTGIDTDQNLVDIANQYSQYLNLPFKAICMDVMDMKFPDHSFDGFLLEFYGNQSSEKLTLKMQQELARILSPDGKGIIITNRRKYSSYWFLGSHLSFPIEWIQWFADQAEADLFYHKDGVGEQLKYGLYGRYHTIESIKKELGYTFNVVEYKYEEDPRYIVCVVTRKNNQNTFSRLPFQFETDDYEKWDYDILQTGKIVSIIERLCSILKNHQKSVLEFSQKSTVKNFLQEIKSPAKDFLMLFEELFEYVTVFDNH